MIQSAAGGLIRVIIAVKKRGAPAFPRRSRKKVSPVPV